MTVRLWIARNHSHKAPKQPPPSVGSVLHSESVMIVEVIDDGPGFGSTNAGTLFKPFYRDSGERGCASSSHLTLWCQTSEHCLQMT